MPLNYKTISCYNSDYKKTVTGEHKALPALQTFTIITKPDLLSVFKSVSGVMKNWGELINTKGRLPFKDIQRSVQSFFCSLEESFCILVRDSQGVSSQISAGFHQV